MSDHPSMPPAAPAPRYGLAALFQGAAYLRRGFGLLTKAGIRRYVAIPLLLNIALFATAIALGGHYVQVLIDAWLPQSAEWVRWIVWPIFALGSILLIILGFSILMNLLGAPFNSMLAHAVLRHLGADPSPVPKTFAQEAFGTVVDEGRKFGHLLKWALPLPVIALIPGLQLFAPLYSFLLGAWTLALEYTGYPMGLAGLKFSDQKLALASRRALVLGFGSAVMLLTLTPMLNFLAMPVAVAGAAILYAEQFRPHATAPRN
jgi:CysZ protein